MDKSTHFVFHIFISIQYVHNESSVVGTLDMLT